MKTAVEWLESRITVLIPDDIGSQLMYKNSIKQAKEMEKEQIVTAHYQGYRNDIGTTEVSEQYYNETFKQQEQ